MKGFKCESKNFSSSRIETGKVKSKIMAMLMCINLLRFRKETSAWYAHPHPLLKEGMDFSNFLSRGRDSKFCSEKMKFKEREAII